MPELLVQDGRPVIVGQSSVCENVTPINVGQFSLPSGFLGVTARGEHDCGLHPP
jgi:hypothetical protein